MYVNSPKYFALPPFERNTLYIGISIDSFVRSITVYFDYNVPQSSAAGVVIRAVASTR